MNDDFSWFEFLDDVTDGAVVVFSEPNFDPGPLESVRARGCSLPNRVYGF